MKRTMTPEETVMWLYGMVEDGHDLACFILMYEIRNGLLIPIDAEDAESPDGELVGIVGHMVLSSDFWAVQPLPHSGMVEEEKEGWSLALIADMRNRILALPGPELLLPEPLEDSPFTLAGLGAWRLPDGSTRFVTYRHPNITPASAAAILQQVIADYDASEAEDAAAEQDAPQPN